MDNQSIKHTRWNCTYHIVFIPKYRRKIMYGQVKKDIVDINIEDLPQYLQDSFSLECETLQMYGMLSSVMNYVTGSMITLSESGKQYFSDKENAYKRAEEQQKKNEAAMKKKSVIRKQYDVFISHASKDKSDYVDLLNMAVKRLGINVFYDTDVLSWGDNWKQVILDGTANSELLQM